jgi:hypothetical protein
MGIQNIIDRAQQIEIDRRRMVSQSVSRSQRIKTAERSTSQPWKFTVTPPGSLPWAASRDLIEVINSNDRVVETQISLNNNPGMKYITEYLGGLRQSQLDNLTISSVGTSTIVLTDLPSISSTTTNTTTFVTSATVIFARGDIVQPANSRYPYAVSEPVLRGVNTVTNVIVNRPIITSENITLVGEHVLVGNDCTWQVLVSAMPTYTLISNRQVQYTGDFELVEKVI